MGGYLCVTLNNTLLFHIIRDLKQKAKELRRAGNLFEVLLWNQIKNKQLERT